MVINLVKRELRLSFRSYAIVLACIVLGAILIPLQIRFLTSTIVNMIFGTLMSVLFFGLIIMSIRASIYIYYTNIYNESGYELFTFPIKLWQIIVSKLITIFIWGVIVSVVAAVSFVLMIAMIEGDMSIIWEAISTTFNSIVKYLNVGDALAMIAFTASYSIEISCLIFLAGAIANSSFITKRRTMWAVILFFVISGLVNATFRQFGISSGQFNFFSLVFTGPGDTDFVIALERGNLLILSLISFITSGVYIAGTLWFWDNKLEIMN